MVPEKIRNHFVFRKRRIRTSAPAVLRPLSVGEGQALVVGADLDRFFAVDVAGQNPFREFVDDVTLDRTFDRMPEKKEK